MNMTDYRDPYATQMDKNLVIRAQRFVRVCVHVFVHACVFVSANV